MFIEAENLDDIYINLNFNSSNPYSLLDLSGYDDEDDLLPHLADKWEFLTFEAGENGEFSPWTNMHYIQVK
jgi:hypothetical protein